MDAVIWVVLACMALAYAAVAAVQWWRCDQELRERQEKGEEFERLSQLSMIVPETPERMERARGAGPLTAQRTVREMKGQSSS